MNLRGRLRKLEPIHGRCAICDGHGQYIVCDTRSYALPLRGGGRPVVHTRNDANAIPGCRGCGEKFIVVLKEVSVEDWRMMQGTDDDW